jgi:hypothetical protein
MWQVARWRRQRREGPDGERGRGRYVGLVQQQERVAGVEDVWISGRLAGAGEGPEGAMDSSRGFVGAEEAVGAAGVLLLARRNIDETQ